MKLTKSKLRQIIKEVTVGERLPSEIVTFNIEVQFGIEELIDEVGPDRAAELALLVFKSRNINSQISNMIEQEFKAEMDDRGLPFAILLNTKITKKSS